MYCVWHAKTFNRFLAFDFSINCGVFMRILSHALTIRVQLYSQSACAKTDARPKQIFRWTPGPPAAAGRVNDFGRGAIVLMYVCLFCVMMVQTCVQSSLRMKAFSVSECSIVSLLCRSLSRPFWVESTPWYERRR